jgi:hypothetical protein
MHLYQRNAYRGTPCTQAAICCPRGFAEEDCYACLHSGGYGLATVRGIGEVVPGQ